MERERRGEGKRGWMMKGRRMTDLRNCGQSSFDVVPRNNPSASERVRVARHSSTLCSRSALPPLTRARAGGMMGSPLPTKLAHIHSLVILIALVVMNCWLRRFRPHYVAQRYGAALATQT